MLYKMVWVAQPYMRLCQYQNFLLCKGSKKFVTNNAKLLTVIQSSILHSWWIFKGCQISLRKITLKLFKKVKLATYLANKPPSGSSEGSYLFRVQSTLLLSHFRQKFLDTYMPSEIRLLKMFLGIRQFLTLHSRKCCYCVSLSLARLRYFLSFATIASWNHAICHKAESLQTFSSVHYGSVQSTISGGI